MYCLIFRIVVQFRLFLRNDPQKAKVTQEQSSNGSCTSTSTSAIHSVSHVEVGSYGKLMLYIIICSLTKSRAGLSNVTKSYVAGCN